MTTMTTTESKTRTITLTDRPPVKIRDDEWPLIAEGHWYDSPHKHQANRECHIRVRQHEDGRAIVYAQYDTAYQGERGQRAGAVLTADEDIAAAIRRVGETGNCQQCIDYCIADLPAEEI
jgi:hypothetical protein